MDRIVSDSITKTHAIAAEFASKSKIGDVIYLFGDLGSGKSEFARGFIRHLCDKDQIVPSPTFTILQTYETLESIPIYHFDLYRINSADELEELGFYEALSTGICLIEWPERLSGVQIPNSVMKISISQDGDLRVITSGLR